MSKRIKISIEPGEKGNCLWLVTSVKGWLVEGLTMTEPIETLTERLVAEVARIRARAEAIMAALGAVR